MARTNSGFWVDFQKFILQGNVIDLAVAVIIGGAFGKIVESFVNDIVTPLLLMPALKAAGVDGIEKLSANGDAWQVKAREPLSRAEKNDRQG